MAQKIVRVCLNILDPTTKRIIGTKVAYDITEIPDTSASSKEDYIRTYQKNDNVLSYLRHYSRICQNEKSCQR